VRTVDVVLPDGVDDPARASGGNVYDRRVCRGLAATGWRVREHPVSGGTALAGVLDELPDGSLVLADGLVACAAAAELVPRAGRLRLVVLLHMPFGERTPHRRTEESAVLAAAAAVVTTSDWTRSWLLEHYPLTAGRLHVAAPGADAAPLATGTLEGGTLLCVAPVTHEKGYDVLAGALAATADLPWRCVCVGRPDDPGLVDALTAPGLADRVRLTGPLTGTDLAAAYASADALVLPSRRESFGMVVVEALARGLPVIATSVGGVAEALGALPDGRRPGILLPHGDADALATVLRRWLGDATLRGSLRSAALRRRATLPDWSVTTEHVAGILARVA
jgi:glycosyltransferase involved in cell wall biosynthesis